MATTGWRARRGRTVRIGAAVALVALAVASGTIVGGTADASHLPVPTGPRSGELLALTYNVAGLPEPLSGSEPDINTPLISPLLNPYDLVLAQEDWVDPIPPVPPFDFYHDDLISAATHPYQSTPAIPPNGSLPARPSALIADGLNYLSRYPITDPPVRVMWPSCFGSLNTADGGAADCLAIKGFEVVELTLDTGVVVDVYNLHGEAGSTVLDQEYSAEDYEVLGAYIVANSAGHAIILGGDTNLHTDDADDGAIWDTFLTLTGLHDVCQSVDCGDDDHRIDKFAFRSEGGIELTPLTHHFEVETFQRESDGTPLSDHDALSVRFAWEVPGPASTTTSTPGSSTSAAPGSTTRPSSVAPLAVPVVVTPRFTG